jgi:hypothetical protein
MDTATQEAMGKMVLQQMQAHTLESIRQAVREELLPEVREEALALARQELEEAFSRRREKLADDMATFKAQLEDELLGELDRQREQIREELAQAQEEKYLTVRDQRDASRAERDRAETLLVALITQLLPGERPVYLYSAGIRELDRGALNATLARHGLRVRSKATYSERLVTVRLDQARVAGHTQFWLEKGSALPVADDDQGDTGVEA